MKKLFYRMGGTAIAGIATFAVMLGETVTAFSALPLWPYEPEMPETIKANLMD